MCRSLADVKWYNLSHAVSAFLTVIVMPLTYSIANGLIAGIGCFVVLEGTFLLLSFVGIKKPEFYPHGEASDGGDTEDRVEEAAKEEKLVDDVESEEVVKNEDPSSNADVGTEMDA